MQLTPGVTINRGDSVTRQTIYDLLNLALGGTVAASDLTNEVLTLASQSSPPTPGPGLVWWDRTDQLMKVYVDVVDGTGCSLWTAFGPDRFDIPMLATEPIPWGAAVQLIGDGRKVKLPPDPLTLVASGYTLSRWECAKVVGFNNTTPVNAVSCPTTPSGSWLAVAVEGFVWSWHPCNRNQGADFISVTGNPGTEMLISGITGLTGPSGISNVRGGTIWVNTESFQVRAGPHLTYTAYRLTSTPEQQWTRSLFLGPRMMPDA